MYGTYIDTEDTQSQFIYPASQLQELNGRSITSVKFFPQNKLNFSGGKIQLSVKEIDYSEFEYETATSLPTNVVSEMTVVGTVVPGANDTEFSFVFDEPFAYHGGNLAFETMVIETGTYSSCSFLGVTQTTNCAFCAYKSWSGSQSVTQQQFLPKAEFGTIANSEPVEETITLAEMLANGVNDTEYTISDDLALVDVADYENKAFLTNGEDWITVTGEEEFFNQLVNMNLIKGGTLKATLSKVELNPELTLTAVPEEGDVDIEFTIEKINLAEPFELKPSQVIDVTGYWNQSDGALRAYAEFPQGQSLTLNTDWAGEENNLENGKRYLVRCAIYLKEAWTENGRSLKDYDYPFQNYEGYALRMPEIVTGIESLKVENVKSVRYYNTTGIESSTPFQGVNIVVMEMTDGTKKTVKVVK